MFERIKQEWQEMGVIERACACAVAAWFLSYGFLIFIYPGLGL